MDAPLALLLLVGCPSRGPDTVDLPSDRLPVDANDGFTEDSGFGPPDSGDRPDRPFEPYYVQVDATFGWDAEAHAVMPVRTPYGEIPPAISISLGDKRWRKEDFSSESEQYCLIVLPLTDPGSLPTWVAFDRSLYFGFDYRLSDPPITDCGTEGYELDPAIWPRNLVELWADYDWGVAIGELRPEHQSKFSASVLLPYLASARIENDLLRPVDGDVGVLGYVAVVSEIDAEHRLVVEPDGRQPLLDAGAIEAPDGGLSTGLYRILPLYVFSINP